MRLYEFDTLEEAREYFDTSTYGAWVDTRSNQVIPVDEMDHKTFLYDRYNVDPYNDNVDHIAIWRKGFNDGLVRIIHSDLMLNIQGNMNAIKNAWRFIRPTAMQTPEIFIEILSNGQNVKSQYELSMPHDRVKLMKIMSS